MPVGQGGGGALCCCSGFLMGDPEPLPWLMGGDTFPARWALTLARCSYGPGEGGRRSASIVTPVPFRRGSSSLFPAPIGCDTGSSKDVWVANLLGPGDSNETDELPASSSDDVNGITPSPGFAVARVPCAVVVPGSATMFGLLDSSGPYRVAGPTGPSMASDP